MQHVGAGRRDPGKRLELDILPEVSAQPWEAAGEAAQCCLLAGTGKALRATGKGPLTSTAQARTGAFPGEGMESPLQAQPQLLEQPIRLPTFTAVSTS